MSDHVSTYVLRDSARKPRVRAPGGRAHSEAPVLVMRTKAANRAEAAVGSMR